MKEIKYSTRVYIDPRNQQVYVRVRWNKKVEVAFALPIKADPTKWDEQLHRAKFNTIHKVGEQNCSARIVNGYITRHKKSRYIHREMCIAGVVIKSMSPILF